MDNETNQECALGIASVQQQYVALLRVCRRMPRARPTGPPLEATNQDGRSDDPPHRIRRRARRVELRNRQRLAKLQAYAGGELYKQIVDFENAQLLSGDGTGDSMVGFYATSGILTHDCAADTGTGETKLDSVEKAITQLRVGPALATPDLLVLNPSDWSSCGAPKMRIKRYLTQPDPTVGEADSLWGISVNKPFPTGFCVVAP